MIDYGRFTVDLTNAAKRTLTDLEARRPGERVTIFGFETDDDVVVLAPVANTDTEHRRMIKERIYSEGDQYSTMGVQEWPLYGFGRQYFAKVGEVVNKYVHESSDETESFDDRRLNLLKSFGRALRDARGKRSDLFLSIFNSDPGLKSLALYYCVARLINPPGPEFDSYKDVIKQTFDVNGSTLREKLLELKANGELISTLDS